MGNLGLGELIIILIIALIIFGPGKLPEVGKALGRTVTEFKKASHEADQPEKSDDSDSKTNNNKEKSQG